MRPARNNHSPFILTQTPHRNRTPTLERAHTHQISEGRLALHLDPRPALVSLAERPFHYTQKQFLTNFLKLQAIRVTQAYPCAVTTHFSVRAQSIKGKILFLRVFLLPDYGTFDFDNHNTSLDLFLSKSGSTVPTNCLNNQVLSNPNNLFDPTILALDHAVRFNAGELNHEQPGLSIYLGRTVDNPNSHHRQDPKGLHLELREVPVTTFSQTIAPNLVDNALAIPPSIQEPPSRSPYIYDISVAAAATRQHSLQSFRATSDQAGLALYTSNSQLAIDESYSCSTRHLSRNGDVLVEGSTSISTQTTLSSSTSPSSLGSTTFNAIHCTWASCGKAFLTRSEYK